MKLSVTTSHRFDSDQMLALEARVPGLKFWGPRLQVPENAIDVFSDVMRKNKIQFRASMPRQVFAATSTYPIVSSALRRPNALLPYQLRVLKENVNRDSVLLKSGTGSGKGLMCIGLALQRPGLIIWVTLAVAKRGHLREWNTWSTVKAQIIDGTKDFVVEPDTRCLIINWDILATHRDRLISLNPTTLVFDELPKAKQPKRAQRIPTDDPNEKKFEGLGNMSDSAARLSKCKSVTRRIGASATFIADRVRDLWSQLDIIYPYEWGSRSVWMQRYADRHTGAFNQIDDRGASNLSELKRRIDKVVTRVSKEESHSQLPPLRREIVRLAADELVTLGERIAAKSVAGIGKREGQLSLASVRKRKVVRELALEALNDGQKVCVMVGRRKEAQELAAFLRKAWSDGPVVSVWGEMNSTERDIAAQEYINAKATKGTDGVPGTSGAALLISTVQSMGRAFDGLQCTNLVLISYLPDTPEVLTQCEGRFSRLGGGTPCLIKYLVAMGSIDETITDYLLDKLDAVQALFNEQSLVDVRRILGSGMNAQQLEAALLASVLKPREVWNED